MPQLLSACSNDIKPYMIWIALSKTFPKHIGFDVIGARGEILWRAKVGSFLPIWVFCVRLRVYLETVCPQHHQTYTLGEALIETFQNHIGFAMIRARSEELWPLEQMGLR